MRISRVKLNNYVCFYDPDGEEPEVELGNGINFVIGKNNSGKTAFLVALCMDPSGRSRESVEPYKFIHAESVSTGRDINNNVRVELLYEFPEREILSVLDENKFANESLGERREFWLPLHKSGSKSCVQTAIDSFLKSGLGIRYSYIGNERIERRIEEFSEHQPIPPNDMIQAVSYKVDGSTFSPLRIESANVPFYIVKQSYFHFSEHIEASIYRFDAERRIGAVAPVSGSFHLDPDASNLAQVLNSLHGSYPSSFEKYLKMVQSLDRSVQGILFEYQEGKVKVKINYLASDPEEPERAIPLDKCGTGLSQLMAILYVILFYDKSQPRVMIIDEPNSFLHPGAIRKLMKIFEKHDHHQYIIATHSPAAIMSVQKKRILLVQRENMVSTVKSIEVDDNESLEVALREIGSKRSDIFGMDAVIWVEGKTDETCFKLIMDKVGDGLPFGTNLSALVNTGDLEGKQRYAELAVQIYQSLSGGVGLLPSVLAFVFDGDKQGEHSKLNNSGYKIEYLLRQNYESYLIVPEILAEILNRDASDDKRKDHTADSVATWIRKREGRDFDDEEWLKSVDGANLLNCMFDKLAGISYEDNKVVFGEEITKRILESDPDHFSEIVDLIQSVLPKDSLQ